MAEIAYLLRHGDYDKTPHSEHLTVDGQEQSANARDELIARNLGGRVYLLSSNAPRALETAKILSEGLDVEVVESPRIRRASEHRLHVVNVLGDFLIETLMVDGKTEADPDIPFVVVSHAPLIAEVIGEPTASKIGYAEVFEIPTSWQDTNYRADMADFVLSGRHEQR